MNKILKLVSIGFFAVFLTVFLSTGTTQASFFDWFNLNKASNDSQQAAVVTNAKATSTSATIKVVSPNGGEVWKAGTKKNIVFKGNLIKEPVTIAIVKQNSEGLVIGESITSGNGKNSTFSWTIPSTIEQRNDYKIFVRYTNNPSDNPNVMVYDESDKTFTIKSASSSSSSSSRSSKSSSSKSSKSSATTTSVYLLKVIKVGEGSVTDEQRQIVCGTGCKGDSGTYTAGSEAILTAVPNGGYVFEKFAPEKECSSVYTSGFGLNDNKLIKQAFAYGPAENVVCVTTMNKNKTITAIFKKISKSSSSSSKSSSSRSSKSSSSISSRSSATTTPIN